MTEKTAAHAEQPVMTPLASPAGTESIQPTQEGAESLDTSAADVHPTEAGDSKPILGKANSMVHIDIYNN